MPEWREGARLLTRRYPHCTAAYSFSTAPAGPTCQDPCYWGFDVGKDALLFSAAAFGLFALRVVVIFGITGLVLVIRRLIWGPM